MPTAERTRRAATREGLIDAATELFQRDGIARTSLESVAQARGVHRVTLHRCFPGGRQELVAEVLLQRALEALSSSLPHPDDPRPTPELLADAFTGFVMMGRTDPLLREGLCSDAAQFLMAPERLALLFEMTLAWRARLVGRPDEGDVSLPHDPRRVTDLWARTVLTLVREPGIVETEADVHAYLTDFVIPNLVQVDPS